MNLNDLLSSKTECFACCQAKTKNIGKWISILLMSVLSDKFSVLKLLLLFSVSIAKTKKEKKKEKSRQYNKICYRLKNWWVRKVKILYTRANLLQVFD